ncbi:MAG: hypothetical protein N2653_03490 [Burkholderiales bacterium]|nr:hypothetical protein [Burkholderiales bacterium]
MADESSFVAVALKAAGEVLQPPLSIRRGAALLYEVTVDNNLALTVDPKNPVRGDSAFQTDLCVFEAKSEKVVLPRVVIEFKTKITTHEVLTYSAKARKHKQVYPYLRYGIVVSDIPIVPRRFFVHNESLDFVAALSETTGTQLRKFFAQLLKVEVEASRCLENIAFGSLRTHLFRTGVHVGEL